jgi:hypothetical protein
MAHRRQPRRRHRRGRRYGDGVDIAARIEALADPGGALVSNTVHDQVRDRLPFRFEVEIVGVEALGRLPRRALDLGLAQLRLDRADGLDATWSCSLKMSSRAASKRSAQIWAPVAVSIN